MRPSRLPIDPAAPGAAPDASADVGDVLCRSRSPETQTSAASREGALMT